jgi:hypothetical protein
MALENTFNIAEQQINTGVEAANEQAAFDVDNALINGAEVDFSTAEDPFGDLGGLNVDNIKNTPENNTGTSITNQGGGPGDPVPPIKPAQTMQDLINLSNKQKASLKNWSQSIAPKIEQYKDPMLAYGAYTFDQYRSNVDRYRGYGKSTFNKIGFNPLDDDNEEHYNQNTTGWQDFKRMTGQWGTLFNSAFFSNYRTVANLFSGNGGLIDPDQEAAEKYEKAMRLGMSSKDEVWGKVSNFTLNLAYTAGIAANLVAEEFALGLMATATGGAGAGAAGARTATNLAALPSRLSRFERMMSLAKAGLAQTSLGAGTQMLKGGFQMLKSFKNINNARLFYTGIKGGAAMLGRGTFEMVNPLRGTTKTMLGITEGTGAYRNLSNFAKLSKGFGAFYRDVRENLFAVSESQLEGGSVYSNVLDEQLKYYMDTHNGQMPDQKAWSTMYDNAQRAGEVDVLANIPIIYLSNRFVFDGLFKFRGLGNAIDAAEEAATKGLRTGITREAGTLTFKESAQTFASKAKGLFTNPKVYLGNFLNYTKANFAEGIQENLQETAGAAITNYYVNVYKNPILGGQDYAKSMVWGAAKDNIWSPQGAEIFLNGFLMGGGMKVVQAPFVWGGKQLSNLYNSKFNKERYQAYLENKKNGKANAINALNGLMADPEYFFGRRRESIVNQARANQNMAEAELNDDDKTFYDSKDEKTFDHIFTALDNKTFDLVIDAFKDMSNLSDAEIASAFNMSDGTKAKDKINEYINRANQIKDIYGRVNKEYSNPFNPKKYKKTDKDNYINEVIAYKSYEDAKKLVIASEFGFARATERLKGLLADISTSRPVMSASATDFTVLQSKKLLNAEIELLADEIQQLSQGGAKQKELADKKKKKFDALVKYSNALENYLASGKSQTNVNDQGQFEVPFNEELQTPLKEAYREYLKAIANINDDQFVFDNKIDDSFKKVLDIYSLDKDAQMYLQNLNGLLNPEMFARHAALINENLTNIYQNRPEFLGEALDEYLSINELNNLTKTVAEFGVKLTENELKAMIFSGQMPTVFLDLTSGQPLLDTDSRVEKAKDAIETYLKLREDRLAEKQANEEAKKEAAKAAVKPAEEEKPKEEPKPAAKPTAMPEDLKGRLQQAYDEYIDNNPDATISFEEYSETSAKAAGIKAQYEAEQKKKAEPKPAEEAKPIELKLAPIEVVKEVTSEVPEALKDIESTTKALSKFRWDNPKVKKITELAPNIYANFEGLAEDYHQFKKEGINLEFVKAVEDLLTGEVTPTAPTAATFTPTTPYGTPTGPEVITQAPTAAPVSDARADIEKNKKADLEQLKTIPPSNYVKIIGNEKDLLKKFREYLTDVLGWERMPIGFSKGNLTLDYLGTELKIPASVNILAGNNAILDINVEDVIEAKYDAELDALEGAKPTAAPVSDKKAEYKREDFPDSQANTRTPITQKLLDYFAETLGIPKFTEDLSKGTYVSWLQNANPIGYAVAEKLNAPKQAFDVIAKYDEELAALEGAKPAETFTEVVTEKPAEKKPKPITIQNGNITIKPTPTDTFSETYTFTVKDGKVVEGRHRTYFQGEYRDRTTDDPITNPAEEYDRLSAAYSEQQITQDSTDVIKESSGADKAKSILDSVSSIKELPTTKLTDNNAATAKLLELVAEGKISSKDLLTLVEQRRNEILEKMNPTDLSKNDYVTFTDGRKGWVTSTNPKKNTVNVKMVGSAKGVVETIGAEDLRKNLVSVETKKVVKVEAPEQVAVSKADKETITESRDTMDEFKNDAAKTKQIADEIAKSDKTDNTDNLNDLLDSLGCDI